MKLLLLLLLLPFSLFSQKKQPVDYKFRPTIGTATYHAITEKKDSLWERSLFYTHMPALAMHGFYLDEACEKPQGKVHRFFPNQNLEAIENYKDGVKHGTFISYRDNGSLRDSGNYENGFRSGIHLAWNRDGWLVDSMNFDGKGNGSQIKWREDGTLESAGLWQRDTAKVGRWKYFHNNGQLQAQIDYVEGKVASLNCFDEKGTAVAHSGEFETYWEVDKPAYTKKLMQGLMTPLERLSAKGINAVFHINVEFVINEDGSLSDFNPLSSFGNGIEEDVVKALKATGPWKPAKRCGQPFKMKIISPVVLIVSSS